MLVEKTVVETKKSVEVEGEVKELLNQLYQEIWCQACYAPDTIEIGEYCGRNLLKKISRLNQILKFKV